MFRYFLVYGKEAQTVELEDFDAQELLWQMLGECCEDLLSRGFQAHSKSLDQTSTLRTDVNLLKRVVDNLESNIIKYAEPAEPVIISAHADGGTLVIRFQNRVAAEQPSAVESNHVGLHTCGAIMNLLGGKFTAEAADDVFTAECILPIRSNP